MEFMFRHVRLYICIGGLAGLAVLGVSSRNAFADTIYRFVDADGVIHLSNAPTDSRYQKVQDDRSGATARPVASGQPQPKAIAPAAFSPSLSFVPPPSTSPEERTGESIYQYMDAAGVVHFSNVPTNPRYKRIRGDRTLARLKPTFPQSRLNDAILLHSHKHSLSPAYDPEENVSGGVRYLRYLLDRFGGNLELALAAYNSGETRVLRENRIPRISETQQYVRKVIRFYKDLSRDGISARPARSYDAEIPPLVTRRFVNYLSPN